MPQCQRSPNATRLDLLPETAPGTWTCRGPSYGAVQCPGGETYELLTDDFHVRAADQVVAATVTEFVGAPPTRPVLFIWGEGPQHIVWDGNSEIYLERGAFGQERFFWQIAQEAFHHLCTPAGTIHWSHEMLSTLWAFQYLIATGRHACAMAFIQREISRADQCTLDVMLALNSLPYPTGLYGRALLVGFTLQEAVGWQQLKSLAHSFDATGRPDVDAWRDTLPEELTAEVTAILTP